ncbi:MAG: hypothetical protein JW866_05280 [Ignavibacteriales bacterium]|nr:hypothetical protein [Ignavibacteriales bacterium]
MKKYFLLILLLSLNTNAQRSQYKYFDQTKSISGVTKLSSTNLNYTGNALEILKWTDNSGQNTLILSITKEITKRDSYGEEYFEKELYIYHYIKESNGKTKLSRKITDNIRDCPFDITLEFIKNSLTITDLDKNGYSEICVLYKLCCRSDVSPSDMKLMMLEKGNKYALRGTMLVDIIPQPELQEYIDEYGWGKYKVDPAFNSANSKLLKFAKQQWEKFKYESFE